MGISAVSSANISFQGTGAAAQAAADGAGIDFLALFTQQLGGPAAVDLLAPGLSDTGAEAKETDETSSTTSDLGGLLADSGLLPFLPPPSVTARRPSGDAAFGGAAEAEGQIAGIIGHLELSTARNPVEAQAAEMIGTGNTASTGNDPALETANIAAAALPESGNTQNFASTLATQTAAQPPQNQHRTEAAATQAHIDAPLHDSRWAGDFSEKVVWLAKNDQQVAQLNINPPQLGPMHITLNLNGEQASAFFASPNAEVRQAIADAMPQLKEMLAGAGINLGQANVGSQMPQQNAGTSSQSPEPSRSGSDNAILRADQGHDSALTSTVVRGGRGMVDLFA